MRVAILTGALRGSPSLCLPVLVAHPDIEMAMVIHCRRQFRSRSRQLLRAVRKTRRIGLGGALVGYRMRRWYAGEPTGSLPEVARRHDVPFRTSPWTNSPDTVALLRESGAELGISLGNGLILPRVYRVPRYGMINVHGEILPRFQGAASVIWPIHEGIAETGFTIHEIEKAIDTGRILYQERLPIRFRETLRETVEHNVREITRRIPRALAHVVANLPALMETARVQEGGRSYTTPTLRQFLRMRREFARLRGAAARAGAGDGP